MYADAPKRSSKRRVPPAVVGLLAATLFAFLTVRIALNARMNSRLTECRWHIGSLELALQNYHDAYGSFPPAVTYGPDGRPWHSWRVLMLPFIEGNSPFIYKMSEPWDVPYHPNKRKDESIPYPFVYRMNEPWDGPNNRKLAEKMKPLAVFRCPSDADASPGETSYLAVTGGRTLWPENGTATLKDATDGPETVMHLVEVANSGVHWMEPKDLRLDSMTFLLNGQGESVRSRHTEPGFLSSGSPKANATFADGSVKPIKADLPPETLRSMLLRDDGLPEEVP